MLHDVTAHIGFLTVEIYIPQAQSLKDKRHFIKSIKDKARVNFNVSVAEIGDLEKWQTATIGFVAIGNDNRYVDGMMQNILRLIESYPELELTDSRLDFI
jgi:uncharacterized protein YlxP (DUF503 family)